MNIFRKCLRREFGKKQYNTYMNICREELKDKDILKEQDHIEEKGVFKNMYQQLENNDQDTIRKKSESIMETLLRAFQIGRQFGVAFLVFVGSCILLITLELHYLVTCISLILLGGCFLYKLCEYISNKVCFMDVYLFMVYKSVLEKLDKNNGQIGE